MLLETETFAAGQRVAEFASPILQSRLLATVQLEQALPLGLLLCERAAVISASWRCATAPGSGGGSSSVSSWFLFGPEAGGGGSGAGLGWRSCHGRQRRRRRGLCIRLRRRCLYFLC